MAAGRHQGFWRKKLRQRAAELWRFMCFQNCSRPPSWIFAEVKFGGISVSGTSVLVFEPNLCEYVQLWPSYGRLIEFLKWRPPRSWISRKWNLTSPEVAGCPYLPPDQIWWRYLKIIPQIIMSYLMLANLNVYNSVLKGTIENYSEVDWIEQGLTSPPTQYRLSAEVYQHSLFAANLSKL